MSLSKNFLTIIVGKTIFNIFMLAIKKCFFCDISKGMFWKSYIWMDYQHHKYVNKRPAISLTIQSMPSNSPSPVLALHPMIPQCLVVIESSSKYYFIWSQLRLPSISCLLQKMRRVAPISFSCFNRLCSSALVSSSLILSELSTTQMTPSVCSK